MGEQRLLEIDEKTKVRLGFYKDETDDTDIVVNRWYLKVGDVIKAVADPDTGSLVGETIVEIEAAKGNKDIEGVGWEIGARIVEILIPEKEGVTINLSKGDSLKLAILEVDGDAPSTGDGPPDSDQESETSPKDVSVEPQQERTTVSPAARRAARERGIDLDEVVEWLSSNVERVEVEHLDAFASRNTGEDEAPHQPVQGEAPQESKEILAAPATRVLAREDGVDLVDVEGSGPGGIILENDVMTASKVQESLKTSVSTETTGADEPDVGIRGFDGLNEWEKDIYGSEAVKPTRKRLAVARNLRRPIEEMVLVGAGRDLNMSPLVGLRGRLKEDFAQLHGIKLRFDHFFLAAVAQALKDARFEKLNARWEWSDDKKTARMVLYRHINLALAVAAQDGLVTPVVMRCEEKTFVEIALEAERLIAKALEGKLKIDEVVGMTFTVNNTGVFGDEYPDPVPNPDTAAILAFGAIRGGINTTPQLAMMRLKFDHQILDGQEIGPFMELVKELLENPEQLLAIK